MRINQAGCLDRCEEGPVLVVYPQGTWYTYVDKEDIDDIIDTHIVKRQNRRSPENLNRPPMNVLNFQTFAPVLPSTGNAGKHGMPARRAR